MSYKYVNGCYEVTIEIRKGFKRFHSMNAQETSFVVNDDNGIPRFAVWQFVSYDTDIMQVVHDNEYDTWIVSFNGNPFSYSPSTSRQVSRWIRENRFFPFTPNDVRVAYDKCLPVTPDISTYSVDNVCFDFHSRYTFHNVWR